MSQIRRLVVRLLRRAVFAVDRLQQRRHHVYEFDDEPGCMLRISLCQCSAERTLSDGVVVRPGDSLIEFHFWNERVPLMENCGPDLAWGTQFNRSAHRSLQDLAQYIDNTPGLEHIVAVRAETSLAADAGLERYSRLFKRLGFDFGRHAPVGRAERVEQFFVSLYVWLIIWVLNPASLRGRSVLSAERTEIWMSRKTLMSRYLKPTRSRTAAEPARGCSADVGALAAEREMSSAGTVST